MSNFLAQGNRLAQIHFALSQRGISISCEKCEQGTRLIYEGSSPAFLLDEQGNLQSQNFPSVILLCQHCGHIDKYSSVVLKL